MPFPPNYQPKRGAALKDALADARWVIDNAQDTIHATHKVIVDGVAAGIDWSVLEEAAEGVIEARQDLADGTEIIEQVEMDAYDPQIDGHHAGPVSDRDRADLERGKERAWTAHLAGMAIIDRLRAVYQRQQERSFLDLG